MPKKPVSYLFTDDTISKLDRIAEHWSCPKTQVLEHLVELVEKYGPIVGEEFGALDQALQGWSAQIAAATADNAATFTRAEWNYLADVNNGCSPVLFHDVGNPVTHIWANAYDGHKLDRIGLKWFAEEGADPGADQAVAELVEKLQQLDTIHGWAMLICLQWFWDHCQTLDNNADEWWNIASELTGGPKTPRIEPRRPFATPCFSRPIERGAVVR